MPSDARSAMLRSIRTAIRAGSDAVQTAADREAEWNAIPRNYRGNSSLGRAALQHRFVDRLLDYDAQVMESTIQDLARSIAKMLRARDVSRMLVAAGLDVSRLPENFSFVNEAGLTPDEMNTFDGILTESTLAIAETGTIVLQNVPGQGRRAATLVPDYHLCLVETSRIVMSVPEAVALLRATATLPTTFISGPSATADIEMTRIKGVHGPRFLDVILVAR